MSTVRTTINVDVTVPNDVTAAQMITSIEAKTRGNANNQLEGVQKLQNFVGELIAKNFQSSVGVTTGSYTTGTTAYLDHEDVRYTATTAGDAGNYITITKNDSPKALSCTELSRVLTCDFGTTTPTATVLEAAADTASTLLSSAVTGSASTVQTIQAGALTAGGLDAVGSLATIVPIVLTSLPSVADRNDDTFTLQVEAAGNIPLDTVNVVFSGGASAVTCTVTPNSGINNPASTYATASLSTITPIILTALDTRGAGKNGKTFTLEIEAAAANSASKIQAVYTQIAGDATLTITPDNTGALKTLTTAQLVEFMNTGVVVAQPDIATTDIDGVAIWQSATGGDTTPLANSGEGDGLVATFAGGSTVVVDLTTAQLVTLINTGVVGGKTITLVDPDSLRVLQTATGGGATVLANSGEGDGLVATFVGGAYASRNIQDITYTAVEMGTASNGINIVYTATKNPATVTETLNSVVIDMNSNAYTAATLKTLVNANATLVTAAGTAVTAQTTLTATALEHGVDGVLSGGQATITYNLA